MASSKIRVGVVGLGRLWEARHKPALERMKDRFEVVGVYDHVARRAEIEAKQIGCRAFDGLTVLVEHPEIDAVLFLAPQWFGSHPIELAARFGKAVYCALPLTETSEELDRLDELMKASKVPFMAEFAPRFYPSTLRLREILGPTIGSPVAIVGSSRVIGFDRNEPIGPGSQVLAGSLWLDPGQSLVDWCRLIAGTEHTTLQSWSNLIGAADEGDFDQIGFVACFGDGFMARFSIERYNRRLWGVADQFLPRPGVQVLTDRGAAWVEWPDMIRWTDGSTVHDEQLPTGSAIGETMLGQFARMVGGLDHSVPTWNDAVSAARTVLAIRQSAREGKRTTIESSATGLPHE